MTEHPQSQLHPATDDPAFEGMGTTADPTHPRRARLRVVTANPVRVDHADAEEAPLRTADLGPMELELGGRLDAVTLAYRTWGRLNSAGDNAVLVLHALTGDSR
ncbi:MAG: homoserine O-acetyltransferase, partial [Chloroflexota bacterium]|nr:homoserine O-acetyltransferase [Chloroflexota bacterium]